MNQLQILGSPTLPTIAEMVASDYRKAAVFTRFGIDFCCGGKKNLADVCREKNLDRAEVEQALLSLDALPGGGIHWDFQSWDTNFLIDFIVNAHHSYVRNQLPRLMVFGEKVARTHGNRWPETREIFSLLQVLGPDLLAHMAREEEVVFPAIQNLVAATRYRLDTPKPAPRNFEVPFGVLENEHEEAGEIMHRITTLSNGFTPPAEACNTFRVWYSLLKEFSEDLYLHVHLENNILFPRVLALSEK
jgi:regulator of cell morphogenesis and NO signaling